MNTGCYKCNLENTSLTHWGLLPCLDYEQEVTPVHQEQKETEDVIHVVKSGESLWRIAQLYYGSGAKWPKIAEANDLSGTLIYPNQRLKIPGVEK